MLLISRLRTLLGRRARHGLTLAALLLAGLTLAPALHAQTVCPEPNYNVQSQADVDAFAALGCTEVTGGIYIAVVADLTGLGGLTSVGDNLYIDISFSRTSLTGLDALTSVGGNLTIDSNRELTSLAGLGALTSVGGDFSIGSNYGLTSLAGLGEGIDVGGSLSIAGNTSLTSLTGLGGLTSVGGFVRIGGNESLTSLAGLDALISVGGDLDIRRNAVLSDGACALAGLVSGDPPAWSGVSGSVLVSANGGAPFDSPANLLDAAATTCNQPPAITEVLVPIAPAAVGADVAVSAPFTDPDASDTHTCAVDYGDGSAVEAGTVDALTCTGTHAYTEAGIYTVSVSVTDAAGESDTQAATAFVVVYDPTGGFVTGGGWIDSPEGAYPAEPTLTGRASFGFVAKYKKGRSTPDGNTQFQFHAAGLSFRSSVYEWLVIAGPHAKFKGAGTIDGAGDFGFMLTATDGDPDQFRIKIWDRTNGDAVVYDNKRGEGDDSNAGTELGGGQIMIHRQGGNAAGGGSAARGGDVSVPAVFALTGAYPNPFAERATLTLEVPEASVVRVVVYDVLGRAVAVLADGSFEASRHAVVLDGRGLPTGTYLVRMTTESGFTQTRRLTLLR